MGLVKLLLHTYIPTSQHLAAIRLRIVHVWVRALIGADMKRLSSNGAIVGVGLGLLLSGTVGLLHLTGADRLVDGRYDQAIAISSGVDMLATDISAKLGLAQPELLRLASTTAASQAAVPDAATEHTWLTRPVVHSEPTLIGPLQGGSVPVQSAQLIASTVGAKFTVTSASGAQTLEVVDVREISAATLINAPNDDHAKFLLVSCRVLGFDKTSGAGTGLVRFIVNADLNPPTSARPPRLL